MSALRCLRQPQLLRRVWEPSRLYAAKASASASAVVPGQAEEPAKKEEEIGSSCPENTILVGVNYLKGQAPVLALKDEEYPPWLWNLLKPKVIPDDGPGGIGEKIRMRKENRARIREQNFMKTQ